jgi:hypothetical protein
MQVDNRGQEEPLVTAEAAKQWCDVCFGVGGDGIIFALPAVGATDLSMRLFNSDGSEPEMCGNGIRCLAKFIADIDGTKDSTYHVHTHAGSTPVHSVLCSTAACTQPSLLVFTSAGSSCHCHFHAFRRWSGLLTGLCSSQGRTACNTGAK